VPPSPNGGGSATFQVVCTAGCDFTASSALYVVQVQHVLDIQPVAQAEGTGGVSTMTFTLLRLGSNSTEGSASVQVDTADGSATGGSDFTPLVAQIVAIPDGSSSATFDVAIVPDAVWEADESFGVVLSNPVGAVLATTSTTGTILNDDLLGNSVPTLSQTGLLLLALGLAGISLRAIHRSGRDARPLPGA
ncbi:MAG TPA: Calx-beta domain-containing protein, partial [Gemmatimonadaceae bacterium]|nr:Calx-beta domain-containing protein [Gemmatimonadaceae bacterium]